MVRVLPVAAVLVALGVGVAIPLLFGDEDPPGRHELSREAVQHRLLSAPLAIGWGPSTKRPPDSVACQRVTEASYECTLWFRAGSKGLAQRYGYDVLIPAYQP